MNVYPKTGWMANRFNVRILDLRTGEDVAHEVARIESYPERVGAAVPKALFLPIHAAGLQGRAAMILKQELLALDGDCIISPAVYLGDWDTPTDALILATLRQHRALIPRLRALPVGDLPRLAEEIERALAAYDGTKAPLVLQEQPQRVGDDPPGVRPTRRGAARRQLRAAADPPLAPHIIGDPGQQPHLHRLRAGGGNGPGRGEYLSG